MAVYMPTIAFLITTMAIEILLPRLGWTMEEGVFVEWLKHDGEAVKHGAPRNHLGQRKNGRYPAVLLRFVGFGVNRHGHESIE